MSSCYDVSQFCQLCVESRFKNVWKADGANLIELNA